MESRPDASSEARLEELRRRWEADRGSRIFLQLAEELRRTGRLEEAIAVLGVGLEHHPSWGAAQVALGRCRLEAGQAEAACVGLEAVVRKDPTQMVAYRLLVDGYLALGDAAAARDRLDLYSELNPQAEELEELEQRVAGMEQAASAFDEASAVGTATSDSAALLASAEGTDSGAFATVVPEEPLIPAEPPGQEPLGDDLGLPDAIDLELEDRPDAAAPQQSARPEPELEPEPSLTAETEGEAPAAPASAVSDRAPARRAATESGPFAVPPPAPRRVELGSLTPVRPLRSPRARGGRSETAAAQPPRSMDTTPAAAPVEERTAPAEPEVATATLGRLYQRQGYAEEAQKIFERVLERDPENPEARAALGLATEETGWSAEAETLPSSAELRLEDSVPEASSPLASATPTDSGPPAVEPPPPPDWAPPLVEDAGPAEPPVASDLPAAETEATSAAVSASPAQPAVGNELGPEPIEDVDSSPLLPTGVREAAAPPPSPSSSSELPPRQPAHARELLAARRPSGPGLTDRKVAVLEAYLERVRAGRERDVP